MNENEVYVEGYGFVQQLDTITYYCNLLEWVYEDEQDGIMLVRNERTGEFRYIELQGR